MSNLEPAPREAVCGGRAAVAAEPVRELLTGRDVVLGIRGMTVTRTLPHRDRRMVGAWCFVDQYGPQDVRVSGGMRVPPHPHSALQTVSWLVEGEVLHRDSLGNEQLIRPGQLNLMTAGRGISHSEDSTDASPVLHGVQLWVALPSADRDVPAHFEHHADLPVLADAGMRATVIAGTFAGRTSGARTYTPLVGVEVALDGGADTRLPLETDFEYAVLALAGGVEVDGMPLGPGPLLYLGTGRADLAVRADRPARVLLLGGEPFDEQIVMWWNFVARSHDEIVAAREEWMTGDRFGVVRGYPGDRLPAPPLPATRLRPRGRIR